MTNQSNPVLSTCLLGCCSGPVDAVELDLRCPACAGRDVADLVEQIAYLTSYALGADDSDVEAAAESVRTVLARAISQAKHEIVAGVVAHSHA